MSEAPEDIRTMEDLRNYIHETLCNRENLLRDQSPMTELELTRQGRVCGRQYCVHGPRSVRLGAIWASDHNIVYFYDAAGERYLKVKLPHRLTVAAGSADAA